ncbi:hypothetical protein GTQ43_21780 [Nostoc sp. KVJ3]|uniref:hypothetical protein n=1 Tax=Nostoc sp. KVJ3 TaxID=457945 RepID=UPI002237D7F0|nr:hypothetical protein [Nostoc sp. KVJ3]MCW5316352.1 hypothetical protein [Nostoc sp. KVJ3]
MKTKFLLVLAATSAFFSALSSVIVAPANAQLTTAPSNVNVTVTVPEVLYLRTVSDIQLDLVPSDLSSALSSGGIATETQPITVADSSPSSGLSTASPFNTTVTKPIPLVFAVWSNNPRSGQGVAVTVSTTTGTLNSAVSGGGSATFTSSVTAPSSQTTAPGLSTPFTGGITLAVNLTGAKAAGSYSGGAIAITANAP